MSDRYCDENLSRYYVKYRQCYSQEILNLILGYLNEKSDPPHRLALDVGCGPGTCTRILSPHFTEVIGLDVSETQLAEAKAWANTPGNVSYRKSPAEDLPFPDSCADLVTVCTALHYFDYDSFFAEVRRVLKPTGVLAVVKNYPYKISNAPELSDACMNFLSVLISAQPIDAGKVQDVQESYRSVKFPFEDLKRLEDLDYEEEMGFSDCLGMIKSYSGFAEMMANNPDELDKHLKEIEKLAVKVLGSEDGSVMVLRSRALILGRK